MRIRRSEADGCLIFSGIMMIIVGVILFIIYAVNPDGGLPIQAPISMTAIGGFCLLPFIIHIIRSHSSTHSNTYHTDNTDNTQEIKELISNITAKKKIIKIDTAKYSDYKVGTSYYDQSFGAGKVVGIGLGYLQVEFLESQIKSTPKQQVPQTPNNQSKTHYLALCEVYNALKTTGGIFVFNNKNNMPISFLVDYCKSLEHSPHINSFGMIEVILPLYFIKDAPIILYKFQSFGSYVGEIIELYLIANNNKIYLFTVEWSYKIGDLPPFALCEYDGDKHINHGPINLDDTHDTIKSILIEKTR